MTLSALRSELAAIHAHDLTPVNVEAVETTGARVWLHGYDRDADQLDGLREDLAAEQAACKEAEAESAEWERRTMALETHMEEMRERGELGNVVHDLREDVGRIQERAREWATRCQTLQAEVAALRKRKGVTAGVCAYSHEVVTLLQYVAQDSGRNADRARDLLAKLHSL